MQHLRVNFRGIWRFELDFFICLFCFFMFKKYGLIFESPVAILHCCPPEADATCSVRINVQRQYESVFIRDDTMHPNTSVNSVNEHY